MRGSKQQNKAGLRSAEQSRLDCQVLLMNQFCSAKVPTLNPIRHRLAPITLMTASNLTLRERHQCQWCQLQQCQKKRKRISRGRCLCTSFEVHVCICYNQQGQLSRYPCSVCVCWVSGTLPAAHIRVQHDRLLQAPAEPFFISDFCRNCRAT